MTFTYVVSLVVAVSIQSYTPTHAAEPGARSKPVVAPPAKTAAAPNRWIERALPKAAIFEIEGRRHDAARKWERLVLDPTSASDVDTLTETVEAALDVVAEFGPSAVVLTNLSSGAVHFEHLAALLRATSSWADDVPGWHDALGVARDATIAAGHDPEDVLYGMI